MIINYSTGAIGVPIEKRIEYLRELRPDVAALNMGSMNYAKYSKRRKDFVFKTVFENCSTTIIELLEAMNELGIRPEHECFDSGHVAQPRPADRHGPARGAAAGLVRDGRDRRHPADRANLAHMAEQIPATSAAQLGRDRHLARPVDARRGRADARRQRARRARGQLLPARRRDGALERRPDREGARRWPRTSAAAPATVAEARELLGTSEREVAAASCSTLSLPLEGVRVLDLSRLLPGGFCSLLLADFGAEVLKVEDTGMGDYVRWAPPYYEGAEDVAQARRCSSRSTATSARSASNLKEDAGSEVLLRLARDYDVLLESFRPGVLDRLGVGYERLREENPGLVYCAITGYGQDGPYRDRSGHDMNYLGLVGLLGLTGEKDGPPIQSAGQIADIGGGALMAAFGILAALRERDRSGEGQFVDVSMADGALSWLAMVAGRYFADGVVPQRGDLELAGRLDLLPAVRVQGRLGVARRARAEVLAGVVPRRGPRGPDREAVRGAGLRGARGGRSGSSSSARATSGGSSPREHDCCLEPVLDLDEALDSELVRAREMVVELDQPGTDRCKQLGIPVKLSRTPGELRAPGPGAGRAHATRCCARPATATRRSPRWRSRARSPGPPARAQGTFMS